MRKKKYILLGALLALLAFSAGFIVAPEGRYFEISKNLDIFARLYREVNQSYVDEPDPTRLMRTAIDAALENMDPYTNFYSESEVEDAKFLRTGQYSGIGIRIASREEGKFVTDIRKDSPADKAGVKIGDLLLGINKESLDSRSQGEVLDLLNGESGTEVQLTLKRAYGGVDTTLRIMRESAAESNVPYFGMVDDKIGYIKLVGFDQDAGREVYQAVSQLKEENEQFSGVILDLRDNLGGRVNESVHITNVFLPKGEYVVEMRGRSDDSKRKFATLRDPIDTEIPLAVLINHMSASASEIVAGAMQDLDRGVIIGRKSFGKGLVQNYRPLSYNTQLKITIAKYYTPSGRCIQAIDYSSRREDGSVGSIPDSLKSTFKTRNGRPVFDGGGIDPDIEVDKPSYPAVVRALLEQQIIFDYATSYVAKIDSLESYTDFVLTDKMYKEFLSFVDSRNFSFDTESDQELNLWKEELLAEGYWKDMQNDWEALQQELSKQKAADLQTHREVIRRLLRMEIVRRFGYEQGALKASFTDDPDILTAVEVLGNDSEYRKVLDVAK